MATSRKRVSAEYCYVRLTPMRRLVADDQSAWSMLPQDTQDRILVDGSIAQDLVRNDPAMARAAKEAATVLLRNAGVKAGGSAAKKPRSASTD